MKEAKLLMCLGLSLVFIGGFEFGAIYKESAIVADCKILGMTRFGQTPMGCRVDGGYK